MPERTKEALEKELATLREANGQLQVYKQQLDAILNNAPVEVYLKDKEGRYLRINKEFEKIFGVKNEEVVGNLPAVIHDPELAASTRNHDLTVLHTGSAVRREEKAKLVHDDEIHTLLTIKFPVFNDQGQVDGLGAIVTDITEQKRMEEQLRRVQKMDIMGQLTGGIAHDFNNILCIVMGNLELLEGCLKDNPPAQERLNIAYKSANRGAELINKMLSVSGKRQEQTERLSLNVFLKEMESIITQSLTVSIETHFDFDNDIWTIDVNRGELQDALLNLCLNARDAMGDNGTLTIRTSNVKLDKHELADHSNMPDGIKSEFVLLSIGDNGKGMLPEILNRATEPFFTTKAGDQGTGLGLSMVQGFVFRSGGSIDIVSNVNVGTEVRLFFPREHESAQEKSSKRTIESLKCGQENVLIVDDEVELLDIAVSHLQSLGYQTWTANNARAALDVLHANPSIDLLLTDVIMPGGMDGYDLALLAQQTYPTLKVLMSSGFTESRSVLQSPKRSLNGNIQTSLLNKPYNKKELSIAVREVLDNTSICNEPKSQVRGISREDLTTLS